MNLEVGVILCSRSIEFNLIGDFRCGKRVISGAYTILWESCGEVLLRGEGWQERVEIPIVFTPCNYQTARLELCEVAIGCDFHW